MDRDEQPQSSQYERPPLDGSLYVPELYDWQYHHHPTQTAFLYSVGESGLQTITYKEFVPAIHRAARLVAGMIGIDISGEKAHYPVVVILSAADTISVFTTLIGMLRLGVVCFPISPRFSSSVVAHLSQKAGATHILVDGHNSRLFQVARNALVELNERRGVGTQTPLPNLHALPIFDEIYGDYGHFDPLPETIYPLSSHAMLVHSSNSTSDYPKVIPWTVQLILATTTIPANSSHDLCGAVFSCHGIELFHPIGLHFLFWLPAYGFKLAVFKPSVPAVSPTSELTFQGMQETRAHYIVTHTRFLEDWWQDSQKLLHLAALRAVIYGGRSLKQSVGNYLARQGVQLCVLYGSTESGLLSSMPSDPQGLDWEYFQLNPQCTFYFDAQGDGSFLAIVMATEGYCPPIINLQIMGQDACATGDLLAPHPTKPDYWKVIGRLDDQIMLLTGEVINPIHFENMLCESPYINAAVIFGRSRVCLGVLLELSVTIDTCNAQAVQMARNLIWPTIELMNASAPPKCHIAYEMMIFVHADKPLLYNSKGYPKRPATLLQYQHEIDVCYKEFHDPLLVHDVAIV
ncbi:hypothetical protein E4T56_gene213 [Termitomyces sp. T112]|nr:hypothetical protein E4T56_gene213 [Termitomyces sp. T112]